MKTAIIHEWLVNYAGSKRVLNCNIDVASIAVYNQVYI